MSPLFKKKAAADKPESIVPEKLISPDVAVQLKDFFKTFDKDVALKVFTQKGVNDPYNEYLVKFATELTELEPRIKTDLFTLDDAEARKYEVTSSPTVLISPDQYSIRFTGAPAGEEGKSFLQALLLASTGKSRLSDASRELLSQLKEKRAVRVFVSPSCPYCPGQVINAIECAVEKPDLVSVECVEMGENPELTKEYGVGSVPHTFFNDKHEALGMQPQERFVLELVALEDAEAYLKRQGLAPAGDAAPDAGTEVDVVIVGAGPAGLTAGIYTVRSGLKSVILERSVIGGQVAVTPVVENYPGFPKLPGRDLMDIMAKHAREYTDIHEGEAVEEIKVGKRIEVVTTRTRYSAKALILTTGATYRKLGIPGEDKYFGAGVNYCATCDGYQYKGKKVAVAGGGNTALTDALYMKSLGVDVTIIHRRDAFRAEQRLQDSVKREEIPVLWNTVVVEAKGQDGRVSSLMLKDLESGEEREEPFDGLFVAVGYEAHVDLAVQLGLTLDQDGFIKVDRNMRTNIPRIYAAGDVTGGVRQIVTAVGDGSTAALSAFEDISNPYWLKH